MLPAILECTGPHQQPVTQSEMLVLLRLRKLTQYISVSFVIFLYVGIKKSLTLAWPTALWDLAADKQTLQSEQPLQVAVCIVVSGNLTFICTFEYKAIVHKKFYSVFQVNKTFSKVSGVKILCF